MKEDEILAIATASRRSATIAHAQLDEVAHGELTDQDLRRMAVQVSLSIFQSGFIEGEPLISVRTAVELANVLVASAASDLNIRRIDLLLELPGATPAAIGALREREETLISALKSELRDHHAMRRKYEREADEALFEYLKRA